MEAYDRSRKSCPIGGITHLVMEPPLLPIVCRLNPRRRRLKKNCILFNRTRVYAITATHSVNRAINVSARDPSPPILPDLTPLLAPRLNISTGTPSVLHRLFMGRTKGLQGDGAGMDVRVLPPKARDNRFERSMGEALRHQNEVLEMQEVRYMHGVVHRRCWAAQQVDRPNASVVGALNDGDAMQSV